MKLLNFKMSIRALLKDKVSFLSLVIGVVISVTGIFLTGIWILDEIYYEDCHKNLDQIYQLSTVYNPKTNKRVTQSTCYPLADEIVEAFPEVRNSFRIGQKLARITINKESFNSYEFCFIDPSALEVLSFDFIEGHPENALNAENAIVISSEIRDKYFEGKSALGKILTMNYRGMEKEMEIKGVYKKPSNSQFNLNFYASYLAIKNRFVNTVDNWVSLACRTYALINEGADIENLETKMSEWFDKKDPKTEKALKIKTLKYKRLREGNGTTGGTKALVISLSVLLLLMLLMVILNYVIFSFLRLKKRNKSIALLKVFGSSMGKIRKEYIVESLFYMFFFSVISVLLVYYLIDDFNVVFDKKLSVFDSSNHIFLFIAIVLIIGFSGVIPLLFGYFKNPMKLLRETTESEISASIKDKLPLVLQLTASLFLIVVSLFYYKQYLLLDEMDLGYKKENIIQVSCTPQIQMKLDVLRSRWKNIEGVESISAGSKPPWLITLVARQVDWKNKKNDDVFNGVYVAISHDYVKTIQAKIIQGSAITEEMQKRDGASFIINEKAKEAMKLDNPIGTKMSLLGDEGEIVGVVKDFYHQNFDEGVSPLIMIYGANRYFNTIMLRLTPGNTEKKVAQLKSVFEEVLPDEPFEWFYLEDLIDRFYLKKGRLERNLVILFAFSVTLICCMGLFALSLYLTLKKKKVIAIRKIHGASKGRILILFIKEYLMMEIIAITIAFPFAYLFLKNWLENFAVKVELTPWLFILAFLIMFLILLSVTLYAIIQAVIMRPAVVLRND